MKSLLVIAFIICCAVCISCNNRVVPLQQTYQDETYHFSVSSSKDEVWTKLIDVLTSRGLSIKTIDKSSGLITTDNTSFLNGYSFENKNGGLTNPNAFVVCTKVRGPFTLGVSLKPSSVTGQWTIVAKQADDKTLVDVKLSNALGKVVIPDSGLYRQDVTQESYNLIVKSTGVFEKSVESALK